ncbi:MAG: OmpA family protein, partial [Pseudomonadota bacterium]
HADARGSDEFNQALSERRALSVSNYLAGQGVGGQRLRAVGFGETRPIGDNGTAAGQALNRRVEIVIDPIDSAFPQ